MGESMETQSNSNEPAATPLPVVLRGTGRGLEILVDESSPLDQVLAELEARLAASPGFFNGASATLILGNRLLPPGGLAHLKAVVEGFGIRIGELRAERQEIHQAAANLMITIGDGAPDAAVRRAASPVSPLDRLERLARPAPAPQLPTDQCRIHVGPLRSGTVLDDSGHVVVVGDVNPGAEIRAGGDIVVMGALRGVAHATSVDGGPGRGFIIALRLDAQQLRIGAHIARAGEPASTRGAEIAYVSGGRIVVEPYQGKLPLSLSTQEGSRARGASARDR
jgi:septum site-determining protein MinC